MAKKWSLKYEILYAGETVYKDISSIAMSKKLSISRYMCGSSFKSAISTANISLTRGTAARYALQQEVFTKLMEAKLAHEMVYFRIYDISIASYIFKGVVDTGNLSMSSGVKPDEFSIEVENLLKLLDDDIESHVEFPLGDIENEGEIADGAYVFNGSDPANSLIIKLLLLRGFSISDIDLANSYQIIDRIPRFVYDPDKKKTYRNRIDTILYEYNAVLDQTDSGKFIIRPMKFDAPVASRIVAYQIENKMKLTGGDNQNDGIKLTWSELALMKNATVYQASVTPTYDGDGVVLDEGEEVEPLGYWPQTGDIEDVFYEFKADFLDREYYTNQSRLKNEDLSLIAVKDMQYELMADDDIVEVEEQREVYPLKAKLLFYNQNTLTKKYIRLFNVLGTALYRKKNNTPVYPSTAKKTDEYVSEYIFSKQAADAFGSNQVLLSSYGDNKYSWTETGVRVQVGDIVNARVKNSSVSAIVLVTSVKWSLVNTETWKNEVSAIGISAFNALVSKDSSSVPGRGPVDGTPGQTTKPVIQYALGDTTGPVEVPDYVVGQKTGEVIDWELGTETYLIGEEGWTYTIPVPSEGEYVWMRIGTYNPATENWPTSWEYTRITGDIGPQGPQGTGVSLVTEYYLASDLDTGITTETAGWATTMQPLTLVNKYLWNYEKITFSDESSQNTIPVIIGVYGDTGRSINAITEYYLATNEATGITRETAGWTTTMQTTTPTNKYLWNYEKIDWSAGTTPTYVDPMIIGVHGESALSIDVIASASVIPTTSRGIPKIASVKYTALLKNITISLASDIAWTCSDAGVTLYPVEGDIYSVNILTSEVSTDSFFVMATVGAVVGQTSTSVTADGLPAPYNFGGVTAVPKETLDGEPLVTGDYFLWAAANASAGSTTDPVIAYPDLVKGEIYEYNGTEWVQSSNGNLVMTMFDDFAELKNDYDSAVIGAAVIKKLVAIDAFIKNLIAENLKAGTGDGTSSSGFRFRAQTDSVGDGSNIPVFDVMEGEDVLFKVVASGDDKGDVIIGDYDNGKGIKYDKSAGTFSMSGTVIAGDGSDISYENISGDKPPTDADNTSSFIESGVAFQTANSKFQVFSNGAIKAIDAELVGTLRTGDGAPIDARVGIRDQSGIIAGPTFTGVGLNDLSIVEEGLVAGSFHVEFTGIGNGKLLSTIAYSFSITDDYLTGLAFDTNTGNLISCGYGSDRIYIHDGISSTILSSFSSPGTYISDITFDTNTGNLISCDARTERIYIHSGVSSTILSSFSSPSALPSGLAFDGANLISCDFGTDRIYIHSGVSSTISSSFSSPSGNPQGLTFDTKTGNLISLDDYTNRIYIHNGKTSSILRSFSTPTTTTFAITFDGNRLISSSYNSKLIYVYNCGDKIRWSIGAFLSSEISLDYNTNYSLNDGVTDYGIAITFASPHSHTLGDYWTFEQGAMRGLSIVDSAGVEYISASDGVFKVKSTEFSETSGTLNISNPISVPSIDTGFGVNEVYKNSRQSVTAIATSSGSVTTQLSAMDTGEIRFVFFTCNGWSNVDNNYPAYLRTPSGGNFYISTVFGSQASTQYAGGGGGSYAGNSNFASFNDSDNASTGVFIIRRNS